MEADFWHNKWSRGEIGFHEGEANRLLVAHFDELGLAPGSRVFLPLCGKTRDVAWLLSRGYGVVGVELSELAVQQLFAELGVRPEVAQVGALLRYTAPDVAIYVGDIFDLDAGHLGAVAAVYDRAAMVALPPEMRRRYAAHLIDITAAAPQLLVTYEYDQSQISGPPFSVEEAELRAHYEGHYRLRALVRERVKGGMRGRVDSIDAAWQLHPVAGDSAA